MISFPIEQLYVHKTKYFSGWPTFTQETLSYIQYILFKNMEMMCIFKKDFPFKIPNVLYSSSVWPLPIQKFKASWMIHLVRILCIQDVIVLLKTYVWMLKYFKKMGDL